MNRKRTTLSVLATAILPAAANASTLLTTEHVDVGIAELTAIGLHWHDETNAAEYEPSDASAYFDPVFSQIVRPGGSQWDFIGVGGGETFYALPQSQDPNQLFLGIGAEEADVSFWDPWNPGDSRIASGSFAWFELSLVSVVGPGHFSMWQNGGTGPIAFMSTAESLADGNEFFVLEGGHAHVNWGFTELGTYEITFQGRGWNGSEFVTGQDTFTFTSVPEPSVMLFSLAGVAAGLYRRRR